MWTLVLFITSITNRPSLSCCSQAAAHSASALRWQAGEEEGRK